MADLAESPVQASDTLARKVASHGWEAPAWQLLTKGWGCSGGRRAQMRVTLPMTRGTWARGSELPDFAIQEVR